MAIDNIDERLMMQELEVEALDRKKAALLKGNTFPILLEYVHNEDRVNDYNKFQDAKDIEIEEMAK
jgi:hypothetical protein